MNEEGRKGGGEKLLLRLRMCKALAGIIRGVIRGVSLSNS
jgi:hypothetical protein